MRRNGSLLIAVPAFLLGSLVTATLTTTAKANPTEPKPALAYEYKVVSDEGGLNVYGSDGFEYVGESAATGQGGMVDRKYTLRKQR